MSNSMLEHLRASLEQSEVIKRAIVETLHEKASNPRNTVISDHKIKTLLERTQMNAADILLMLKDDHKILDRDLNLLTGRKMLKTEDNSDSQEADPWGIFYDKLKDLNEFYVKGPGSNIGMLEYKNFEYYVDKAFDAPFIKPKFSGEESEGKYVDMEEFYNEFINIHGFRKGGVEYGSYLGYLQKFDHFHEIPMNLKEKYFSRYSKYLELMMEYLTNFFKRTQPLADFSIVEKQNITDFKYKWEEGTIRGWESKELDDHSNSIYCRPCMLYFKNENTYVSHMEGKKHRKNQQKLDDGLKAGSISEDVFKSKPIRDKPSFTSQMKKDLAFKENYIMNMKNLLCDVIQDTMNQIRKKQTRTIEEYTAEKNNEDEDIPEESSSDSEDEEPSYNPKNYPIGWDGKPIPPWLFKLHGLGIEYKCEICGNYSYWGRRAFERHFQEWRHAYGMKCLRIPNTIHFKEITLINDALVLHKKLLMETEISQFNPELEEEYEDDQGNIVKKKTYSDLVRQGILDDEEFSSKAK